MSVNIEKLYICLKKLMSFCNAENLALFFQSANKEENIIEKKNQNEKELWEF